MDNEEQVTAVQRMQTYIDQHLHEPITLYVLAGVAGYSPWHAARIFKELTGKSPFEYMRAVRLSRAAIRLRNEDVRVVDVAFDFVFDSHEGFTRAFSKQFGLTPQKFARSKTGIQYFLPNLIHQNSLSLKQGDRNMSDTSKSNTIFVQVVDRSARKLILKRGIRAADYYAYCEEVGCEVWDVLCGIQQALFEPVGMWLPEDLQKPGSSSYVQGVEVPLGYSGPIPEGFEMIEFPPAR